MFCRRGSGDGFQNVQFPGFLGNPGFKLGHGDFYQDFDRVEITLGQGEFLWVWDVIRISRPHCQSHGHRRRGKLRHTGFRP
jgi:hypothetical protein